ncbi:MAG: 23S rRNA (guanosine(2251)-2'-O)-methyltransferase RlmB [Proteobacteria bacterium]|nr:23S rRNA (guanosine(2251)-2'-O)-methyltransferase RlmB [Pseudomonadota bacterium]
MKSPYRHPAPKSDASEAKPWTEKEKPWAGKDKRPAEAKPWAAKDKSRFAPKPKKEKPRPPEDCDVLYGIHSVREALSNPRRAHHRLLVTENALVRLSEGLEITIKPEIVKPEAINALLEKDAVHQGAYLETKRLPLLRLNEMPQDKIIVALDQVTDPHNVGAILRSACAFDVGALLVTFRHSPEVTGVLAKAASGALEHVPFAGVTNLGRALTELKDQGFTIVGLDSEAPEAFGSLKLKLPLVLVLGAEGRGLRPSTRELCDHLARLELPGAIRSLNVSNAAAICLYAVQEAVSRE